MSKLLKSDAGLLSTASIRASRTVLVAAAPQRLWSVLAEEPAAWGAWCPGFSSRSGWVAPGDPGIGSQRIMRAFGTTFLETVLEWDESQRFTFSIDECGVPGLRRFVESWLLRPAGESGEVTAATWSMAVESVMPDYLLRRFLSTQQTVMMTVARRRLNKLLRGS